MEVLRPPIGNKKERILPLFPPAEVRSVASVAYQRFKTSTLFLIITLTVINAVNYLDRQIINILAEPIKRDLVLKDWEVGALTGLAFGLLYTIFTIPIARIAERTNRPRVIAGSLAVWSLFTLAGGFAQNFVHLALARMGVGLGEAGCTPAAHSLITDSVPPKNRALAISAFSAGMPVGTLLGMVIGGLLADAYGWRIALMVVGCPGLLLVFVVTILNEPRSGRSERNGGQELASLRTAVSAFWDKRSFRYIVGAAGLTAFLGYAHNSFFSAFFLRAYEPELNKLGQVVGESIGFSIGAIGFLGLSLGIAGGMFGILGAIFGGWYTDRLTASSGPNAYMTVPLVSVLASVPLALGTVFVPDAMIALACASAINFTRAFSYGGIFGSVQGLAIKSMRSTASAVLLFTMNVIGIGLGPISVGAISDLFARAGYGTVDGLRMALALSELTALLAAFWFLMARRTFAAEVVPDDPGICRK